MPKNNAKKPPHQLATFLFAAVCIGTISRHLYFFVHAFEPLGNASLVGRALSGVMAKSRPLAVLHLLTVP